MGKKIEGDGDGNIDEETGEQNSGIPSDDECSGEKDGEADSRSGDKKSANSDSESADENAEPSSDKSDVADNKQTGKTDSPDGVGKEKKKEEKKKEEKKKEEGEEEAEEKTGSLMVPVFIIAIIGVTLAVVGRLSVDNPSHNYNTINIFKNKIDKMKVDFPNQNDLYWNMLRNGGKKHLTKIHNVDHTDLTPLSYIIAGYAGSGKTIDCFVSRLAAAYTNSDIKEHEYIDSVKFSGDDDKVKLNDELQLKLNGSNKFVVVDDIDKLKFKAAQLFMSFADEHNKVASYPQSLIIFTTELPFAYEPSHTRKDDEGEVGNHFKSIVWEGAHIDQSAPLWSRVGDGLILIRGEDEIPSCK